MRGTSHVNDIEGFWSVGLRRLQKFDGISA